LKGEREAMNAAKSSCTHRFKIVVVGDSEVGKTSLVVRFVEGTFSEEYIKTIGVNFFIQDLDISDNKVRFLVWDTAGQERFGPVRQEYFQGAKGAILVYDKANQESFDHIDFWMEEINRYCSGITIILVGNKADLVEVVTTEQGQQLATKYNLPFLETSAKTGENTTQLFHELGTQILAKLEGTN
jgi:Ras-related protein Rab-1A